MLRHNNPQLDTTRLGTKVRRRADTIAEIPPWQGEPHWLQSLEGRTVALGATRLCTSCQVPDYATLLALPAPDFVDMAYRVLLGRLPSRHESSDSLERLLNGHDRERYLLELAELARRYGLTDAETGDLPGLARGLKKARLKFKPKVGRVLRWLLVVLRLDQLRDRLHHSISLQDARYRALLELHREQARALAELERSQARLQVEHEVLREHLANRIDSCAQMPERSTVPERAPMGEEATDDGRDFYRALEARFRGAPGAIAELMREHLPTVRDVESLQDGLPLLDLGCGRGEWLALLQEAGITAKGVDLNAANIRACREQGLAAHYQDALAALRDSDAESLGMITAFHLVEHLTQDQLRELLDEAFRALAPGGRLLLETPNPRNLVVGSCTFYLDPTHVRPLPPEYLAFLAEFSGFDAVRVEPLHPVGSEHHLSEDSETARRLNHHLYGPQDYALLATKPKADAPTETRHTSTHGQERPS